MYKTRIADDEKYPGRGPSKFYGRCKLCDESYHRGDAVNWNPRVKGSCCHASCYAVYGSPKGDEFVPTRNGRESESTYTPVVPTSTAVEVDGVKIHKANGSALGETLADAIAPYLDGKLAGLVTKEQVTAIVNDLCKDMIFKSVTCVEVVTMSDSSTTIRDMGIQHREFPTLLETMKAKLQDGNRLNVWLVGPAGTGKTTAAKKCAEALGLDFYFTGSIDTEYKLMGFVDAQGRVVNTAFKKAFTEGGVFLFDECDSSLPPALLAFNAALANGECAFPDGIFQKHPDCIIIAAANTWGLGQTIEYCGRMKMDAAFLDRFVQLEWDIDETMETVICPNKEWVKKVQTWRAKVKAKGLKGVMLSPRASYNGAAMLAVGMNEETVIKMTVRKAMNSEQWESVKGY